jgi:hypothetical protein
MTTLYDETFRKPPQTLEPANMDAARAFHMGHHSNSRSGMSEGPPKTVYQATYVHHKDTKPSDMCDSLKGGHNIVANDPRFVVRKSQMESDYAPYPGVHRPEPVDNFLQQSHLQLKGAALPWTATQEDYFQYETYKMPGRPF